MTIHTSFYSNFIPYKIHSIQLNTPKNLQKLQNKLKIDSRTGAWALLWCFASAHFWSLFNPLRALKCHDTLFAIATFWFWMAQALRNPLPVLKRFTIPLQLLHSEAFRGAWAHCKRSSSPYLGMWNLTKNVETTLLRFSFHSKQVQMEKTQVSCGQSTQNENVRVRVMELMMRHLVESYDRTQFSTAKYQSLITCDEVCKQTYATSQW